VAAGAVGGRGVGGARLALWLLLVCCGRRCSSVKGGCCVARWLTRRCVCLPQAWIETQKEFAGMDKLQRNVWIQVGTPRAAGGGGTLRITAARALALLLPPCARVCTRLQRVANVAATIVAHSCMRARTATGAARWHRAQQRHWHASLGPIPRRPAHPGLCPHPDDRRHRAVNLTVPWLWLLQPLPTARAWRLQAVFV
jgi:hypothetical protein